MVSWVRFPVSAPDTRVKPGVFVTYAHDTMRLMLEKHGFTISLASIFLGIGIVGVWLLMDDPMAGKTANAIMVRSTGGFPIVYSADLKPGNILLKAGIRLFPSDRIFIDGQQYEPGQSIMPSDARTIQLIPASRVTIAQGNRTMTIASSAPTLGQALWEAGYRFSSTDRITPPLDTPLGGDIQVSIGSSRFITVEDGEKSFQIFTSAETVDQALAEAGFAITALDTTEPAGDQPLPSGQPIRVFRNVEFMEFQEKILTFEKEQIYKEELDQGENEIIQEGENGLEISRERVFLTNGEETDRRAQGSRILKEPVKQIANVGTKPVERSVDIGSQSLDYYRIEDVYVTSYSPCRQGYDHCSTGTASGTPLAKGVIAVTPSWYRIFAGTQIYIPGYGIGTVADTGGGIPGKYWIDLGYGEEDFINWHQTVTVYFLNPAPPNVPEVLP